MRRAHALDATPLLTIPSLYSAPSADEEWSRNLKTGVLDDIDSDMSDVSERLVRPKIKKGDYKTSEWLFSPPSSHDSP